MNILERFLKYVQFETTSDGASGVTPSTAVQRVFAEYLVEEMKAIGLEDVTIDEHSYVMATLPSNTDVELPTIGFIAHIDTAPDMSGKDVKPRIVKNYDGENIVLDEKDDIVMKVDFFPELKKYVGQDIIVTDGHTLLGADDKAGVAEIMAAMEYLIAHPEIKHGKVRVAFTPDEEIGLGAHKFDVEKFGAEWAYTVDGGEVGELEYENFNAAGASIKINGCNVHPGTAKNKMINAIGVAMEFAGMLPALAKPEHTEGYQGFFHLVDIKGAVETASMVYIVRDHDRDLFEKRKQMLVDVQEYLNAKYGANTVELTINDQYYNMKEKVEPVMHIVDLAFEAMKNAGIKPIVKPIRGGTDGSQLSFKGLPCPNIFTGGHNFHGRYEYIPIQSMEKAAEVIVNIIQSR